MSNFGFVLAFLFFTFAWVFSFFPEVEVLSIVNLQNVGFMGLTLGFLTKEK